MPFSATVYNVLIASPSDVPAERALIAAALHEWNSLNSAVEGKILLPVMWETHSAPMMGDRPQDIINKFIVRDCDMLIGCFWTRLGSPTGKEDSGTVEEIKYFLNQKKPAMLYYSKSPVDLDEIDHDQHKMLKEFKASIRDKGLQEDYKSTEELRQKLSRHLTIVMREMKTAPVLDKKVVEAARAFGRNDSIRSPQHESDPLKTQDYSTKIWMEDYTEKAFILRGDTISHKQSLHDIGGKWITLRDKSKGWMFSKKRIEDVAKITGADTKLRDSSC